MIIRSRRSRVRLTVDTCHLLSVLASVVTLSPTSLKLGVFWKKYLYVSLIKTGVFEEFLVVSGQHTFDDKYIDALLQLGVYFSTLGYGFSYILCFCWFFPPQSSPNTLLPLYKPLSNKIMEIATNYCC